MKTGGGWLSVAFMVWGAWVGCALGEAPPVMSLGPLTKPADPVPSRSVRPKSRVMDGRGTVADWIQLPPPAENEYLAADEEGMRKGVRTIGIVRNLPEPVVVGGSRKMAWSETAGGIQVWAVVVESSTATGIRLGLEDVVLPEGMTFQVSGFTDPEQAAGPYSGESLVPGERFWTETVFDQAVVLEFQAPETADTGGLEATLSKLAHWTLPFESLALLKAGNCHNDVTCSDANWRSTGNGVAGIGTIGDSGVLWCTGTLLNNTRGDFTDYFLTANHCVGSQTAASTTEYYWLYQTPACNGTPPNPTSVPRTGLGADYLQGRNDQTGNDFAFLRLRRRAPGGVTYAGWTASHPGSSAAVKGIHHPDGSFKRISHGAIYGEDVNFWTVRWTSGVTEPGSSGSPLFNSSRQVIGQLWGGYSSCGNPSGLDEYGRFNVTYPLVSAWISPPTWDSGYQDLGSGWRRLAWFGDYVPLGSDGWIWHNRHRFWFASANSGPESLWFFTQDMGWLWTSRSVYPFLYRFNRSVWLWYNGSSNPRWFRNMTTGQWESRP